MKRIYDDQTYDVVCKFPGPNDSTWLELLTEYGDTIIVPWYDTRDIDMMPQITHKKTSDKCTEYTVTWVENGIRYYEFCNGETEAACIAAFRETRHL